MKQQFLTAMGISLLASSPFMAPVSASTNITGNEAVEVAAKDYPNICRVRITLKDDQNVIREISECTGSLIAKDTVITAAHCFADDMDEHPHDVSVQCGNDKKSGGVVTMTNQAHWEQETQKRIHDVAKVHFNGSFSGQPAILAQGPDEFFDAKALGEKKKNVNCMIAGFGLNSSNKNNALYLWRIKNEDLQFSGDLIRLTSDDGTYMKNSVDEGDSGGPIYCALGKGPFKLIGVVGAYGYDNDVKTNISSNRFAAIWLNLD